MNVFSELHTVEKEFSPDYPVGGTPFCLCQFIISRMYIFVFITVLFVLDMSRALAIGHSFIARLASFIDRCDDYRVNGDFNLHNVHVRLIGRGGKKLLDVYKCDISIIAAERPDIVYIELGSNDLCDPSTPTSDLVQEMLNLCMTIHNDYDVHTVILGQVLFRSAFGADPGYNSRVVEYNVLLQARCKDSRLPWHNFVVFWKHKGLWNPSLPTLAADGVHLTEAGMAKHYFSISRALVFTDNRIRGIKTRQ